MKGGRGRASARENMRGARSGGQAMLGQHHLPAPHGGSTEQLTCSCTKRASGSCPSRSSGQSDATPVWSSSPPLRPRSQVGASPRQDGGPPWGTRGQRPLTWADNNRRQPSSHVRGVCFGRIGGGMVGLDTWCRKPSPGTARAAIVATSCDSTRPVKSTPTSTPGSWCAARQAMREHGKLSSGGTSGSCMRSAALSG